MNNEIRYPVNVEFNVNHEYWHLRETDPTAPDTMILKLKFSFGNCLDGGNQVHAAPPFGCVPKIAFRNPKWTSLLETSRFPALAGWQKDDVEILDVLSEVVHRVFLQFEYHGVKSRPEGDVWYGQNNKVFGNGTVHHAVGTLRMPYRPTLDAPITLESVADEDLRVLGTRKFTSAICPLCRSASVANPVRTLAALDQRLSKLFC